METLKNSKDKIERKCINDSVFSRINEHNVNTDYLDKHKSLEFNKFFFFILLIILLVGVLAYFIIIANMYGKIISFIIGFLGIQENIINTFRSPNIMMSKVNIIIGLKIYLVGMVVI